MDHRAPSDRIPGPCGLHPIHVGLQYRFKAIYAEAEYELLRTLQRFKDAGWPLYESGPIAVAMKQSFIWNLLDG